jgi:hypothetical protein
MVSRLTWRSSLGFSPTLASLASRSHIGRVVRIAISPAAFNAITATLPGSVGVENKRDAEGNWQIWLPHDVLAKLNHLRGPGDSYSDVILRVAEGARA